MSDLTVVLLAGGKGTRLAGLHPDLAKCLSSVEGKPFLHWLIAWFKQQGLDSFVFSLGHQGAQIETWLRDAEIMSGVKWRVHHEQKPLGTGGGVRACLDLCAGDILVANADSLLLFPLPQLLNGFKDTSLNGALIGVPMPDCSRYGALQFNAGGLLTGFREKQPGEGEINSGLYVFRKAVIAPFPENTPLSMEYDIIPKLIIERKRLKVFHAEKNTPFIDIGTPESLTQADQFIRRYLI